MVFSTRAASGVQQETANAQEVYHVWRQILLGYIANEKLDIWLIFVHDLDFKLILSKYRGKIEQQNQELTEMCKKLNIKTPDAPRKGYSTSVNTEVIHDEQIALWMLEVIQETLNSGLQIVRTSTTNDKIRKYFTKQVKEIMDDMDSYLKYLKLKGWMYQPPMYPNIPKNTKEQLDTGEAFHLWDHLTIRYDNIDMNRLHLLMAHDGDLKAILNSGLTVLLKDAELLEKECKKFGLSFPKPPSEVTIKTDNTEILDDDLLYRNLLAGVQGAIITHTVAFKECVTNDRIRKLFKKLMLEEIDMADKLIVYGKVKGWLNEPPQYIL